MKINDIINYGEGDFKVIDKERCDILIERINEPQIQLFAVFMKDQIRLAQRSDYKAFKTILKK